MISPIIGKNNSTCVTRLLEDQVGKGTVLGTKYSIGVSCSCCYHYHLQQELVSQSLKAGSEKPEKCQSMTAGLSQGDIVGHTNRGCGTQTCE